MLQRAHAHQIAQPDGGFHVSTGYMKAKAIARPEYLQNLLAKLTAADNQQFFTLHN